MPTQVIIIEDDQSFSEKLIAEIKKSPDYEVAARYKTATSALGQSRMFKPDLFLMDVDRIETINLIPSFKNLYPNAEILGLMEYWNSKTSYACSKAGVTGCVLKNFTLEEMQKSLEIYKLRGQKKPTRIISFFSPKGRAGRTTVASMLALMLAEKSGERVALIDADLQFGDMPIFFDVEPKHTVVEAIQDITLLTPLNLDTYFHTIKDGVSLLSSPSRPEYAELVDVESLVEVVHMTTSLFRYILIDLPTGFNPISISMCDVADTNILMAMLNDVFCIHHMRGALEMFQTLGNRKNKKVYTCFTRVNPCTDEERLKIQRELGYPVTDILPNEYQMISLANSGKIVKGLPTDTLLMEIMSKIADDVISGRR